MKIAVTHANGQIFQHFGHTKEFKIYEVEGDKVVSPQILGSGEFGHESLTVLLKGKGVELLTGATLTHAKEWSINGMTVTLSVEKV